MKNYTLLDCLIYSLKQDANSFFFEMGLEMGLEHSTSYKEELLDHYKSFEEILVGFESYRDKSVGALIVALETDDNLHYVPFDKGILEEMISDACKQLEANRKSRREREMSQGSRNIVKILNG